MGDLFLISNLPMFRSIDCITKNWWRKVGYFWRLLDIDGYRTTGYKATPIGLNIYVVRVDKTTHPHILLPCWTAAFLATIRGPPFSGVHEDPQVWPKTWDVGGWYRQPKWWGECSGLERSDVGSVDWSCGFWICWLRLLFVGWSSWQFIDFEMLVVNWLVIFLVRWLVLLVIYSLVMLIVIIIAHHLIGYSLIIIGGFYLTLINIH